MVKIGSNTKLIRQLLKTPMMFGKNSSSHLMQPYNACGTIPSSMQGRAGRHRPSSSKTIISLSISILILTVLLLAANLLPKIGIVPSELTNIHLDLIIIETPQPPIRLPAGLLTTMMRSQHTNIPTLDQRKWKPLTTTIPKE